jgi:hypothetical protein
LRMNRECLQERVVESRGPRTAQRAAAMTARTRSSGRGGTATTWDALASLALVLAVGCHRSSPDLVTKTGAITATADDLRTGWYSNQPALDPGAQISLWWSSPPTAMQIAPHGSAVHELAVTDERGRRALGSATPVIGG